MRTYRRDFDETKYVSFLTKYGSFLCVLLEKYDEIQEKVRNSVKKEFNSEPVYNKKYVRTKIKPYKGKFNINFRNDKIPKEGSQVYVCQ